MADVSAEKHAKAHIGIQLVAGSSAGAISKTAVAPLERVRIILQVRADPCTVAHAKGAAEHDAPLSHPAMPAWQVAPVEERYQGIARTLYRIAKVTGPIERLSTLRAATNLTIRAGSPGRWRSVAPVPALQRRSAFGHAQEQGFRAYWRGNGANVSFRRSPPPSKTLATVASRTLNQTESGHI